MNTEREYIAVDLDGSLAHYDSGDFHKNIIGEPIELMLNRVKQWLKEGIRVKIFTARVSDSDSAKIHIPLIDEWCLKHLGQKLEITCEKDFNMIELWDDRAIQLVPNTGLTLEEWLKNEWNDYPIDKNSNLNK